MLYEKSTKTVKLQIGLLPQTTLALVQIMIYSLILPSLPLHNSHLLQPCLEPLLSFNYIITIIAKVNRFFFCHLSLSSFLITITSTHKISSASFVQSASLILVNLLIHITRHYSRYFHYKLQQYLCIILCTWLCQAVQNQIGRVYSTLV